MRRKGWRLTATDISGAIDTAHRPPPRSVRFGGQKLTGTDITFLLVAGSLDEAEELALLHILATH